MSKKKPNGLVSTNAIDEHKALEVLKTCPKIVQDYVKALKSALNAQTELSGKAIGKIQELSKEIKNLKGLK